MKKKMYESLRMDVVFIHDTTPLLAGSVMTPGGDNEPPGAPEFNGNSEDFEEMKRLLFP